MTNNVKDQLSELNQIANQVSDLVDNCKSFGNTEKQTLFLTYFDINVEHLQALSFLISKDLNGSAFALVRTMYETFFRALWVNAFATDEQLKKIRNDKFNFMRDEGNMGHKIEKLNDYYTGNNYFKDLKVGAWGIMSDFTHSGSVQLSSRWTDDELKPNYKESEILEVIIETTETYLLFTYTLFKLHGCNNEENKVLDVLIKYREKTNHILDNLSNRE